MGDGLPARGYGVDTARPFTPEERAEFEWWEQLGHQAWAMIDEWEREELPHQPGEHNGP